MKMEWKQLTVGQSHVDKTAKRFWVFRVIDYYPSGGFGDLDGSFDTLEEAKAFGEDCCGDTVYIYDKVDNIEYEWSYVL